MASKRRPLTVFVACAALVVPTTLTVGYVLFSESTEVDCETGMSAFNSGDPAQKTPDIPAYTELFDAIKIVTKGEPRRMLAHLMGTKLESNWGVRVTSRDGAFGNYQIQNPGMRPGPNPDITVEQALEPAYAAKYMAPRYEAAMKYVNPALWSTDPQAAGESVAYSAERPRVIYHTPPSGGGQGPEAVHQAYVASIDVMRKMGVSLNFSIETFNQVAVGPASPNGSPTPQVAAPTSPDCNPYSNIMADGRGSAATVIKAAQKYLGYPYVYGGGGTNGPSTSTLARGNPSDVGFDCSGLTQYAYHQAGIELPRLASDQYEKFPKAHRVLGQELPGDLVFFGDASGISHVGIVVDPQKHTMIDAPQTGQPVQYDNYTTGSLVGFVHLLPDSTLTITGVSLVGPDGFTSGSCVIYVIYILRRHLTDFPNVSGVWLAGGDIANTLGKYGYKVDNQPAIHATVSWSRSQADPFFGHVAVVSGKYTNGDILVEESNWTTPNRYGRRIVPAATAKQLTYAHTEVSWK